MRQLSFDHQSNQYTVENPSMEQVEICILSLDNASHVYCAINLPEGDLSICGGVEDRVLVIFQHNDPDNLQWGKLIDPNLSSEDGKIQIRYLGGGITEEELQFTVTKADALWLASYYLENDTLPRGLAWQGSMEKYA